MQAEEERSGLVVVSMVSSLSLRELLTDCNICAFSSRLPLTPGEVWRHFSRALLSSAPVGGEKPAMQSTNGWRDGEIWTTNWIRKHVSAPVWD